MSKSSETYAINQYEKGNICSCGGMVAIAGMCQNCYDARPESYYQQSRKILNDELIRIGMEKKPDETREQFYQRHKELHTGKSGTGLGSIIGKGA